MDDIVLLEASDLSGLIRRREVSCVEVMTAYLDHIDEVNGRVNAIVALRPRPELLAEAAEKDALLGSGTHLGWMHGLPHAVKDLSDVAGMRTTAGFFRPPFDQPPATADSVHVQRIRSAGAIFIGKTNTPEFGLGSHTYNEVFGTTLNPYDPTRSAGGSSGGASAALALRMLPVADGSDFFGSLRNPAAWNNILGFRPSLGRVPGDNPEVFVSQAGVEGPMARTALDLALLLSTMSGYDPRAPLSIEGDLGAGGGLTELDELLDADLSGARVAWLGDLGGYLPTEPGLLDLCRAALPTFAELGMDVDPMDELPTSGTFGGTDDLWPTWLTLRHWLVGGALSPLYADPVTRAALKPEAIYEIDGLHTGADGNPPISGLDAYEASRRRTDMYQAFRRLFQTYRFVVLPSAQVFPFDASQHWPQSIAGTAMSSYHRWMEVTAIGTLLGAPVVSLPVGVDGRGLPMGVQVIAANHADLSLLQLARGWEGATGWVQRVTPQLLEDAAVSAAAPPQGDRPAG